MNTVNKSIEMLVLLMKAKKKKKNGELWIKIGDLTRLITKKSDD